MHGLSLAAKILHCNEFAEVISNIDESIYCAEAAEFFTTSLECSLKEALFSLHKSSQTFPALDPAIAQIEKLKGQLFWQMFDCVRANPGKHLFFFFFEKLDFWLGKTVLFSFGKIIHLEVQFDAKIDFLCFIRIVRHFSEFIDFLIFFLRFLSFFKLFLIFSIF